MAEEERQRLIDQRKNADELLKGKEDVETATEEPPEFTNEKVNSRRDLKNGSGPVSQEQLL